MALLANGERIAELRERRGWTAPVLAERVGTTAGYLYQIEGGHRNAGKGLLTRLANAFEVDLTEISEYQPPARRGAA